MIEQVRRRMMMGGSANSYDAEVEWIASDGATVIDTGIYPSNRLDVVFNMYVPNRTKSFWFFGARNANGNAQYAVLQSNESWTIHFRYGNNSTGERMVAVGDVILRTFGNILRVQDSQGTYTAASPTATFSPLVTMWIFGLNDYTNKYPPTHQNLKGVRAYPGSQLWLDGTTLVADYIPVRKDGKGYLYDKVTQQLLPNVGANNLTYGPDV